VGSLFTIDFIVSWKVRYTPKILQCKKKIKGGFVPLEFHSLSHGRIAFGFFNIDTDLLLLEKYFFFAHFFCNTVEKIASWKDDIVDNFTIPGYVIESFADMGNLMAAIHGIDLRGFIGAVYQLFPFPQRPEEFKQKLDGKAHRAVIEDLINQWGKPVNILVEIEAKSQRIKIAEFVFSKTAFHELVAYVWRGGMPGWQDRLRPDYVREMNNAIHTSVSPLFASFEL
jgi:hypothetical protein